MEGDFFSIKIGFCGTKYMCFLAGAICFLIFDGGNHEETVYCFISIVFLVPCFC